MCAISALVLGQTFAIHSVPLVDGLVEKGESPAEALETKEKRELLGALLKKLNEAERAALVWFELDGLSGEQIATLQAYRERRSGPYSQGSQEAHASAANTTAK